MNEMDEALEAVVSRLTEFLKSVQILVEISALYVFCAIHQVRAHLGVPK